MCKFKFAYRNNVLNSARQLRDDRRSEMSISHQMQQSGVGMRRRRAKDLEGHEQ